MERDSNNELALVELGTISNDTHGDRGVYWEGFALQPHAGISDE